MLVEASSSGAVTKAEADASDRRVTSSGLSWRGAERARVLSTARCQDGGSQSQRPGCTVTWRPNKQCFGGKPILIFGLLLRRSAAENAALENARRLHVARAVGGLCLYLCEV